MLVAVSQTGRKLVASDSAAREEAFCPYCSSTLIVRIPSLKIAHFAHPRGRRCAASLAGPQRKAARRRELAARRRRHTEDQASAAGQAQLFPTT